MGSVSSREISDVLMQSIIREHPNATAIMIVTGNQTSGDVMFAGRFSTPAEVEQYLLSILLANAGITPVENLSVYDPDTGASVRDPDHE